MAFSNKASKNKGAVKNTDPLFMLTELLMRIDQRAKIVPIPKKLDKEDSP